MKEIVFEIVALGVMWFLAHRFCYNRVRMEERPVVRADKERIELPKRLDNMVALRLRATYKTYNKTKAIYDSSVRVELPSSTCFGVVSLIGAVAMTALVWYNHIAGIAQLIIGNRLVGQMELEDAYLSACCLLILFCVILWFLTYFIARAGAISHAQDYAEGRVRKNRVVYFYQRYSVPEIGRVVSYLVECGMDRARAKHEAKKAMRANDNTARVKTAS